MASEGIPRYSARLIAQKFKWSLAGVILLYVTVQGHRAKEIYDPGCVGVALSHSHSWASRHKLPNCRKVTLTISSANGVFTIARTVYNALYVV